MKIEKARDKKCKELIKKNKKIIIWVVAIVGVILIFPLLLNVTLFNFTSFVDANELSVSNWVGFYGSYYGGIFGGALTLIGVFLTINFYKKQSEEEKHKENVRLLKGKLMNLLKKIDKSKKLIQNTTNAITESIPLNLENTNEVRLELKRAIDEFEEYKSFKIIYYSELSEVSHFEVINQKLDNIKDFVTSYYLHINFKSKFDYKYFYEDMNEYIKEFNTDSNKLNNAQKADKALELILNELDVVTSLIDDI
jgi:hypothetical protein